MKTFDWDSLDWTQLSDTEREALTEQWMYEVTHGVFSARPDGPRLLLCATPHGTTLEAADLFSRTLEKHGAFRGRGFFQDMRAPEFRRKDDLRAKARAAGLSLDSYLAKKGSN